MSLEERMAELGRRLSIREGEHQEALEVTKCRASELHGRVKSALDSFHEAALAQAPQLEISLGEPRVDDKHLRSFEFDLTRGRHRAIVVVKSQGEVTLVGPFHRGKTEGPCRTYPIGADAEIEAALADLLIEFVAEATTP